MSSFEVGDQVRLKSGQSPVMVVSEVFSQDTNIQIRYIAQAQGKRHGDFICRWWEESSRQPVYSAFSEGELMRAGDHTIRDCTILIDHKGKGEVLISLEAPGGERVQETVRIVDVNPTMFVNMFSNFGFKVRISEVQEPVADARVAPKESA